MNIDTHYYKLYLINIFCWFFMKRFSFLALMLFMSLMIHAAQQPAIIAVTADNDEHTYALADVQNIFFSEANMVVNKKDASRQANVRCVKFGATTAINEVENDGITLFVYPNPVTDYLQVIGAEKNAQIRIVSLQGNIVKMSNESRVDVANLLPGVYLLKVNGKTLKFVKQ
ncbi:MAG: T9SS type A sorting domain-containing protein [Paludibacteraceae bacterium]|nr:T9SS type A sorting domain-containing protein [Paludibacteraceae bacterium]